MSSESAMDVRRIMELLPHRYPFLLIDKVLDCEPGKSIRAVKNVTANEPFFPGHFPNHMVMPGVLVVEAMAQASGVLAFVTAGARHEDGSLYYFVGIDKARFKRPVVPGDQLLITTNLLSNRRGFWRFESRAEVDGKTAATGEFLTAPRELG